MGCQINFTFLSAEWFLCLYIYLFCSATQLSYLQIMLPLQSYCEDSLGKKVAVLILWLVILYY